MEPLTGSQVSEMSSGSPRIEREMVFLLTLPEYPFGHRVPDQSPSDLHMEKNNVKKENGMLNTNKEGQKRKSLIFLLIIGKKDHNV